MRVLVVGAAGRIGTTLLATLPELGHDVHGLDLRAPEARDARAVHVDVVVGDCRDPSVLDRVLPGTQAVVHLAGVPTESALPVILDSHVLTLGAVLDGMRRHGVNRLVYASSNHATGWTPRAPSVLADAAPRPDTLYGVGKVAAEALVRLYVDRYGLSAACLRIGSFLDRPTTRRHLTTWLSPGDCARLVDACLRAPELGCALLWGVSGNTRGWWDLGDARTLGYEPLDDAEAYADEILATPETDDDRLAAARVGGEFAGPGFDRPADPRDER